MSTAAITQALGEDEGPFFFGFACSCVLYGWYMSQVWEYYKQCSQDRLKFLLGVAFLTVLETVHIFSSVAGFYAMLITPYGVPMAQVPLGFYVYYLITPITVLVAQLFFVYRLYRLCEGRRVDAIVLAVTIATAIAAAALGIQFALSSLRHRSAQNLDISHYKFIGALMSGLSVVCDSLLTWALCRRLAASRNGFSSTERTIQGITTYILNRGIILLAVQLASFIAFLAHSKVEAFLFFPGVLSKLYANSLISFLIGFEPERLSHRAQVTSNSQGVASRGIDGAPQNIHLGISQTTAVDVGYDAELKDNVKGCTQLVIHV